MWIIDMLLPFAAVTVAVFLTVATVGDKPRATSLGAAGASPARSSRWPLSCGRPAWRRPQLTGTHVLAVRDGIPVVEHDGGRVQVDASTLVAGDTVGLTFGENGTVQRTYSDLAEAQAAVDRDAAKSEPTTSRTLLAIAYAALAAGWLHGIYCDWRRAEEGDALPS